MKLVDINKKDKIKVYQLLKEAYEVNYNELSKIIDKGVSGAIYRDGKMSACIVVNPRMEDGRIGLCIEGIHGTDLNSICECLKSFYESTGYVMFTDDVITYLDKVGRDRIVELMRDDVDTASSYVVKDFSGFIGSYKGNIEARMYTSRYEDKLARCIAAYHEEINKDEFVGSMDNIRDYIRVPEGVVADSIVIVLDTESDNILGYMVFGFNDQYGLVKRKVYLEYMYVVPEYRKTGKIAAIMYGILAEICSNSDSDLTGDGYVTGKSYGDAVTIGSTVSHHGFVLPVSNMSRVQRLGDRYKV